MHYVNHCFTYLLTCACKPFPKSSVNPLCSEFLFSMMIIIIIIIIIYNNNTTQAMFIVLSSWKSLREFTRFIWRMQGSVNWPPTFRPSQPTWAVSPPVGCRPNIHHLTDILTDYSTNDYLTHRVLFGSFRQAVEIGKEFLDTFLFIISHCDNGLCVTGQLHTSRSYLGYPISMITK